MELKVKMMLLGLRQVDMIFALRDRGINITAPQMSSILNGRQVGPKADQVLAACDEIIKDYENNFIRRTSN